MLKYLEFEKSEERDAISNDYSSTVLLLDQRLGDGQITHEQHEKGHKQAWQTMLLRCRLLAETYKI
jgi:hypothetical protein